MLYTQVPSGERVPYSLASQEFEEGSSEEEEEEEREAGKLPPGAVQVLPPLSDQLQLLSPSSSQQDATQFSATPRSTADLYSTVKKKPIRCYSEGEGGKGGSAESDTQRSRSGSLPDSRRAAGNSLFMHDLTPPWKQIVRVQSREGPKSGTGA
jgi:hypothetical protein